ncbi:MAG: FUSC family protein, partial [Mycobacteriaceae bacterium]
VGLGELEVGQRWSPELARAMASVNSGLREDVTDAELRAAVRASFADAEASDTRVPSGRTVFTAARAVRAYQAVHDVQVSNVGSIQVRPSVAAVTGDGDRKRTGLHPSTRAALQVAVATAAATGVGEWISPSRGYWAVLAAFVVFTGTTSRGDILTRGGQRVLGTLTGVIAGVLLAAVAGQDTRLQLALIVVCVFAAFYVAPLSSTVFVFFFTVLLAMLYGVLGTFSVGVLELRLVETAAGAVVGISAAFLVLPTRTRATVTGKLDDYIKRLDTLVHQSVYEVLHPSGGSELIAMSRELDTALAELQTAAAPLVSRFLPRTRSRARQWLTVMRACDHYTRPLARAGFTASVTGAAAAPEPAVAEALSQATAQVREHLAQLGSLLHGAHPAPAQPALPGLRSVLAAQPPGPPDQHARRLRSTVFALVRIDRAVLELLPGEDE